MNVRGDGAGMMVTVSREAKEEEALLPDGANVEALLVSMGLLPDAHLVLRDGVPVPVDERLGDGDRIKVIRVASGG